MEVQVLTPSYARSPARYSSKLLQHGRPQLFKGKNPSPTIARIEEPICVLLSVYLVYICDATEHPSLHLNREVLWLFCRVEGYAAGRMAVTPLQMRPQKETFYSSQTLRRLFAENGIRKMSWKRANECDLMAIPHLYHDRRITLRQMVLAMLPYVRMFGWAETIVIVLRDQLHHSWRGEIAK